jgi:hypothetical protein
LNELLGAIGRRVISGVFFDAWIMMLWHWIVSAGCAKESANADEWQPKEAEDLGE